MAYQVLARKWRPQKFDDVVGQGGVTRTLQNAIGSGRIAQAFVFAGPRGVGKTTSARILARALNCETGPTADPCGVCDACREIAAGRDMDVLEIDAATHTQVDKVREVIISGLSIPPVRDRYKIFIIDEVHQLSGHSFNALLKSIEEPPPHIVFMMATTELQKIPETILSRSQVHEFRTIPERAIADQLRKIAKAEQIDASDEALALVARAADGSMRDGLTAFDQVLAFAGSSVTAQDVSSVLGIVGRDLLLDILLAVADEHAAAAFDLAGRAIESGYDLKLLCRELSRLVRDLMLISVDPRRLEDPEVAPAGERDRIAGLVKKFSREDLLRSFDVIARAEVDLRTAGEPRYHLEMALLRWMYLRKLAPLGDLIQQLQHGGAGVPPASRGSGPGVAPASRGSGTDVLGRRSLGESGPPAGSPRGAGPSTIRGAFPERPPASRPPSGTGVPGRRSLGEGVPPVESGRTTVPPASSVGGAGVPGRHSLGAGVPPASRGSGEGGPPAEPAFDAESDEVFDPSYDAMPSPTSAAPPPAPAVAARPAPAPAPKPAPVDRPVAARASMGGVKESFLAEVERAKAGFARLTVAGAHKVEVESDRIVFWFGPAQKMFKDQVESNRTWLEPLAARVAGRKMMVVGMIAEPPAASAPAGRPPSPAPTPLGSPAGPSDALKAAAAADPGMQTLLELMPLEIKDVERM